MKKHIQKNNKNKNQYYENNINNNNNNNNNNNTTKTSNVHVQDNINSNSKRILLFPGENYEFNEKLIHYDVFGFAKENLVSKKCSLITISKYFIIY